MSLKPRDYYARSRRDKEQKRQNYYGKDRIKMMRRCRINRWKRAGIDITYEKYEDLLKQQDYRCAICYSTRDELDRDLAVDHDHITGQIRGLLCRDCNWFVVRVLEKYPGRISIAQRYLEKWKGRK